MSSNSMQAWVINTFGDPAVFERTQVEQPALKPGTLRVDVRATSLNPVDAKIRSGAIPDMVPNFPAILHMDVSGIVTHVADDVTDFSVGDEIYACAGGLAGIPGALADSMRVDARLAAPKPATLSFREAAALPLVAITAWEGLIDKAAIGPGDQLLVHGGTGGVGHVALQLAKWKGAEVTATASTDQKLALARQLGADHAINYTNQPVDNYVQEYTSGHGFDAVFATAGDALLQDSFAATRLNGQVITTTAHGDHPLDRMHQKGLSLHVVFMLLPMLHGLNRAHHGHILRQLAELVDNGSLQPLLDDSNFIFNEAADAHAHFEASEHTGKIVLSHPEHT